MPLQYVPTDANRPEKKDQVLIAYVYCMVKLSIKHLFIYCGYSNIWLALEFYTHMLRLTLMGHSHV